MSIIFKGKYIVIALAILTLLFGGLFIILGPTIVKERTGILNLGIRYEDEQTLSFGKHRKNGPGAVLKIFNKKGNLVNEYHDLYLGRNLIPLDESYKENQIYLLNFSAENYFEVNLSVIYKKKKFHPLNDHIDSKDYMIKTNMIGVRFKPSF